MKYRPSRLFLWIVIPGGTLVVALWFGVLPDLREAEAALRPGEIMLTEKRPEFQRVTAGKDGGKGQVAVLKAGGKPGDENRLLEAREWLGESWEGWMRWKHNPWKRTGDHGQGSWERFRGNLKSGDPVRVAKAREIQRLAEAWLKRMKERYPELAVKPKVVPDERNAFLKWIEFTERRKAVAGDADSPSIPFGKEMVDYLAGKAPWNAEAARAWLTANAGLMDEIRGMGMMTEASTEGIAVDRYGFLHARLAKGAMDALVMEARLAAENGDAAAAMESVRAARGLATTMTNVESPTLLHATVRILVEMGIERQVFSEILPALPAGSRDVAAWEAVVNPQVDPPAEFARIMKGEWSVGLRQFLLPMMLDPEEANPLPDAGQLLDAYTLPFAELARFREGAKLGQEPAWPFEEETTMNNAMGLSHESRQMFSILFVGARAWSKGWDRAQHSHGLMQAAFTMMKGDVVPVDPVRGLQYQWDPATRTLGMPAGKEFEEMGINPVMVPGR